jgi:pimeloyl-ACP methyl ester carboxylesterase
MTIKNNPVVFIHGLWLHASSWSPWVDLFEHAGYTATAPGWPGVRDTVAEARENPEDIADKGIDDVVEHYARIIKTLPSAPILVGHSFGGMIAEKLLGMNLAAAAVAIDAAQIKGVLPLPLSALHSTLPVFKNPANKHRAVTLTREQFRYSFGHTGTGKATVRGGRRQLLTALTGRSEHEEQRPRATAVDHGRQGPHRPRGHHQVDPQAIPPLVGGHRSARVRRPRPLPHDRPRVDRSRGGQSQLARQARALNSQRRS